jgi:hypothetical protein
MASLDVGSAMHTICDPLSPLLFEITMEALNSLVALAERRGLFTPLKSLAIRHRMSLYADDMVVFVAPMDQDVLLLRALLGSIQISPNVSLPQSDARKNRLTMSEGPEKAVTGVDGSQSKFLIGTWPVS